ncbi:IclR family transcriptional regulator [Pseudodonghicola flavimaris]|uniref:IclR family transcriptional regulator n=1 Tax=Pseudodonghicola flavimaris TaxID=3050036 RepID=A0ABT7EYA3_9RHOB|nr:IclR family transcriptional regulator [Pseudodonghicola flavimaris]MDK3017321.1 IclR family transcriptional regulator [Pseudodonghicola flavimaris]
MSGTVGKALRLLELLSTYDAPVRLSELSRDAQMNKSTAYRMLESLRNLGYVQQDEPNGRYMITTKMWQIGVRAFQRLDIRNMARPYLDTLARETDEPAVLAIIEGNDVVIVDRAASSQAIQTVSQIGSRTPIHCSSLGKAFLMVETEERLQMLKRPLQQFTPKTLTRLADLRANVEAAREAGIATAFDEFDEGVSGVSAPILGSDGKVHCTIGITLPTARADGETFEACKAIVRQQADLFSAQLGYEPR